MVDVNACIILLQFQDSLEHKLNGGNRLIRVRTGWAGAQLIACIKFLV